MAFKGTRCISSSVESRGNGTYLICFAREWLSNPLPKVVLGVDVYQWKRKTPSMRKINLPVLWQLRAGDVEKRSVSFPRSEEHTSELQSLMRISNAVLRLEHTRN